MDEIELRAALEDAFVDPEDQQGGAGEQEDGDEPNPDAQGTEPDGDGGDDPNPDVAGSDEEESSDDAQAQGEADEAASAEDEVHEAPAVSGGPADPSRPPVSWNPAVREKWSELPEEVRAEVARREYEIQRTLSQTAEERKVAKRLDEAAAPYREMMVADGVDPVEAAQHMFELAGVLRGGDPMQRAQVIATLIQRHAVPVEAVAAVMGAPGMGQPPGVPMAPGVQPGGVPASAQPGVPGQQPAGWHPPYNPNGQTMVDPHQIAEMAKQELQQELEQKAYEQAIEREREAIKEFAAKPEHEFFGDVREIMADMIEAAKVRGVDLTLEDAYNRAIQVHPDVSRVLEQRRIAAQQQQQRKTGGRKPSVKPGQKGGSSNSRPNDLRAILDQQFDDLAS